MRLCKGLRRDINSKQNIKMDENLIRTKEVVLKDNIKHSPLQWIVISFFKGENYSWGQWNNTLKNDVEISMDGSCE